MTSQLMLSRKLAMLISKKHTSAKYLAAMKCTITRTTIKSAHLSFQTDEYKAFRTQALQLFRQQVRDHNTVKELSSKLLDKLYNSTTFF